MTITIVFDHRNRTKSGQAGPVELRITDHRKSTYVNTGIRARKSELVDSGHVLRRGSHALLHHGLQLCLYYDSVVGLVDERLHGCSEILNAVSKVTP